MAGTSEAWIRSYVDLFMEDLERRMEPTKQNESHWEAKQTSAEGSSDTGINAAKDEIKEGDRNRHVKTSWF